MNTIQQLNDTLRRSFIGGQVVLTQGIRAFPEEDVADILSKVRSFNDFTQANDPYHEHDLGTFSHKATKIIWKIDYYDKQLRFHSVNPADTTQTIRVLTIMTADEY